MYAQPHHLQPPSSMGWLRIVKQSLAASALEQRLQHPMRQTNQSDASSWTHRPLRSRTSKRFVPCAGLQKAKQLLSDIKQSQNHRELCNLLNKRFRDLDTIGSSFALQRLAAVHRGSRLDGATQALINKLVQRLDTRINQCEPR